MNKHLGSLAIAAGSLLLCLPASAASPGQSATGTKSDCTDAAGKPKKDCGKINSAGKSANPKPAAKTAQAATSSAAKASDTRKDADKVSDEHMSTRGLKPPPKDADKDKAASLTRRRRQRLMPPIPSSPSS